MCASVPTLPLADRRDPETQALGGRKGGYRGGGTWKEGAVRGYDRRQEQREQKEQRLQVGKGGEAQLP